MKLRLRNSKHRTPESEWRRKTAVDCADLVLDVVYDATQVTASWERPARSLTPWLRCTLTLVQ
jgi:hypothetical protein